MPFDILAFLFWTAVSVGLAYAVGQLTQKKVKPPSIEPNDLDMPTAEEGVKYTVVFGTCWIENPVVAWWGDVSTMPIIRHYTVNKWFNNKRVNYIAGYHYAMGAHHILTQGQNDGVKQIKIGDVLAWPDPSDKTALQADEAASATINQPDLFGGEDQEGGVVGTVDFQYGGASQSPNSYLQDILGADISATRGLTAAILRQVRFGTSHYPKPWRYLIKRTAKLTSGNAQWYGSKASIGTYHLNPAHILRECYTNAEWGFGNPVSLFPDSVWQAAADTLYSEGFGLSLKWEDQNQTLEDFVRDVLRHIDGIIYQDPSSGYFVLKLVRDDYVVGNLEEFDDSDIEAVEDFTRGAYRRVPTAVRLRYWNMLDNEPVTITDHDIALMEAQGGRYTEHEVSYVGVMDDALAAKLVARERLQITSFCAIMKIKAKRSMSHLRPGDVFKLIWPVLNIEQMVVRVLKVNYGSLTSGYVTLECAEDVFAVQTGLYAEPPASGWQDPRNEPAEALDRLLQEAPFWEIYQDSGLSDALALDDDSGFLTVAAKKPSSDAYDYELLLRDGPALDFYSEGRGHFTPNGMLDLFLPMNAQDAIIDLMDAEGLGDVQAGTYAVIGDEIVKVKAVDAANSRVTVARGCLDTVPAYHSGNNSVGPGARVWFAGSVVYISGREYTDGNQPGVKILPRTDKGQLAEASATAYNANVFDSRMNRPYPPGNLKVNGASYPSSFSGQPTVTWAHRDRTQQLTQIVEHSAANIGPETGTTYKLQIYDEDNVLVRTETGLTGTSYNYTLENEMADCGIASGESLNSKLRFVLKSVRNGYESWQGYDLTVQRV